MSRFFRVFSTTLFTTLVGFYFVPVPVDAQITAIDPRIDPASQSVRVIVEIANPDRGILAGSVLLLEQN